MDISSPSERYCLSCRHSLRGIRIHNCPECGRAFDPEDSRTTWSKPVFKKDEWLAAVSQAIIKILAVVTGLFFLTALFGVSPFIFQMCGAILGIATIPVVITVWYSAASPSVPLSLRVRIAGVVLPLVLVSILWTWWPFRLTFLLHKPALSQIANQISSGQAPMFPQRVGLFKIKASTIRAGNTGLKVSGGPGGGIYFVRLSPNSTRIWFNTNWEVYLGDGWYYVYED